MRKMKKILLVLLAVFLFVAVWLPGFTQSAVTDEAAVSVEKNGILNSTFYYDGNHFLSTLPATADAYEQVPNVKGLICTHHILASELIHRVLLSSNGNDYERIVIIGPDHKSRQGLTILLTDRGWQTPFGVLETDQTLKEAMLTHPFTKVDNEALALEHSSAALIPYIRYHFPNVTITTLALPSAMNLEESRSFGLFLADTIDDGRTLLIASIDFSHYLSVDEAYKKDEETLQAIANRSFEKIYRFTNDHLDSPQTLIAFLTYVDQIGCQNQLLLDHKNAYDLLPADDSETTSYFTVLYH